MRECPHCASYDVSVITIESDPIARAVQCKECGAIGPRSFMTSKKTLAPTLYSAAALGTPNASAAFRLVGLRLRTVSLLLSGNESEWPLLLLVSSLSFSRSVKASRKTYRDIDNECRRLYLIGIFAVQQRRPAPTSAPR